MDALSQLLRTLQLDIVSSRQIALHGPYGARFASGQRPRGLFMVMDGDVWVETEGDAEGPLHLSPGDISLFGGQGFVVRDSLTPCSRPVDVHIGSQVERTQHLGGPGRCTAAFQGVTFELEAGMAAPLLAALSPSVPRPACDSLTASLCLPSSASATTSLPDGPAPMPSSTM